MISLKNFMLSLLFSIAIFLTAWTIYLTYHKTKKIDDLSKPDAYMEDVVATVIDHQGKTSLKIVAKKMVHFAEGDITQIRAPVLTIFRKSPKPWYLTADFAKTLGGTEKILLWNNVRIQHPGDIQNEATTLLTPTLLVHPQDKTAKTSSEVTILQPNTKIHAIGMNADLSTGTIKLLSEAQGEFIFEND